MSEKMQRPLLGTDRLDEPKYPDDRPPVGLELEHLEEHHWLIHTERLGPNEYGASRIVGTVDPEWGPRLIAAVLEADALREALEDAASWVHNFFSQPGPSADHPTLDWHDCPGPQCSRYRAALSPTEPEE